MNSKNHKIINQDYISPIPSSAQKVFSGILFDVYHWEQKQFDGTYKTFEALKRLSSVQVIAKTKENKFVILKEEQPQDEQVGYSLIGGGCDFEDELPQEGARRELLEETGMKCDELELFEVTHPGGKIDWPCYYFIAHDCEVVQEQNLDSGEKIEVLEVDFEEFLTIVEDEHFRNKYFSNYLFRILHTPNKFEELKEKLRIN
ncbi:MAG: NUDIX hydrolase [Nanoarchaeota archaeon]|nr:NUDIX hydrolase [Nanoarchaeota archaeon]